MAKDIAGRVCRLDDLVTYQSGAIVSRVLLKRKLGSITVFAFDAGEALSTHSTPFAALIQVLEGEAEVTLSGKFHRLGSGDSLLMPADAPHAVRAAIQFKMLLTLYKD